MKQFLAGDIGGTKTILRLVNLASPEKTGTSPQLTTHYEAKYPSQHYRDLVPMVQEFLQDATQQTGQVSQPQRACFGIAGPVNHNRSQLTNVDWSLDGDRLAQELSLEKVSLINDFAAIGYGVLGLSQEDLFALRQVEADPTAPIGIIGAGTGLGQGFLIPQANGYQVYPTEGGHVNFAPRDGLEFALLQDVLDRLKITRVSVERLISGQGIVAIYQFLRDRQQWTESAAVAEVIRQWEQAHAKGSRETVEIDPGATIAQAASNDPLCAKTMQLFIELYGMETGNFALKLLPYGGLYIAGGIAAKNLELMKAGAFMQAFQDKGRVSAALDRVPIYVVLNPQVGLIGAALYAAKVPN